MLIVASEDETSSTLARAPSARFTATSTLGVAPGAIRAFSERYGLNPAASAARWSSSAAWRVDQFFFVVKAVAPHMIAQGSGGAITAITSVDGFSSSRFHAAYGAAKAGIISLVKTYSDEFGRYGIRVNCVAPGNVGGGVWDKPDVPFGQDAVNSLAPPRPMDIANGVLFLSSSLSARVTGQTLVVDGGATTRSPWGFTEESLTAFQAGWREERN